ncbi:MAG: hypothetical protein KAX84_04690 [Burkholderiales bacterium]|nr:hypothetical protein [Burkholderiales bacterium]
MSVSLDDKSSLTPFGPYLAASMAAIERSFGWVGWRQGPVSGKRVKESATATVLARGLEDLCRSTLDTGARNKFEPDPFSNPFSTPRGGSHLSTFSSLPRRCRLLFSSCFCPISQFFVQIHGNLHNRAGRSAISVLDKLGESFRVLKLIKVKKGGSKAKSVFTAHFIDMDQAISLVSENFMTKSCAAASRV